eukprot:1404958-Prymnesium_polylepis.1
MGGPAVASPAPLGPSRYSAVTRPLLARRAWPRGANARSGRVLQLSRSLLPAADRQDIQAGVPAMQLNVWPRERRRAHSNGDARPAQGRNRVADARH